MKEIIPQFLSTLIIISAILVVSQLVRLSEVLISFGLSLENVLLPFLYNILPFLSLTIPIAYLFTAIVSFSRLSTDGELTAMFAAGYSMKQVARPVILVSVVLFFLATACGLYLEAWGRRSFDAFLYRKAQTKMDTLIKTKLQPGVFQANFLGYVLYAEKISKDRTDLVNVMMAPGSRAKNSHFTLTAPIATITGSVETEDLRMTFQNGSIYTTNSQVNESTVVEFKFAELDLISIFQDRIFGPGYKDNDYRGFGPFKLRDHINDLYQTKGEHSQVYLRAKWLYVQRMFSSFSVIFFGVFGMLMGIQRERHGKGGAYTKAIIVMVGAFVGLMGIKSISESGSIDAFLGIWLLNFSFLGAALFLLYQKNRLPLSENPLDPKYIPFIDRFFQKK